MRRASTLRFKRRSLGRWEECPTGDQSNPYLISTRNSKIRNDPPDPQIKKLKEAVFWSIKQVYTEDQYS